MDVNRGQSAKFTFTCQTHTHIHIVLYTYSTHAHRMAIKKNSTQNKAQKPHRHKMYASDALNLHNMKKKLVIKAVAAVAAIFSTEYIFIYIQYTIRFEMLDAH